MTDISDPAPAPVEVLDPPVLETEMSMAEMSIEDKGEAGGALQTRHTLGHSRAPHAARPRRHIFFWRHHSLA